MRGVAIAHRLLCHAGRGLRQTGGDLLEFIYPTSCAACGMALPGGALLCDACEGRLHELRRMPACVKCASPLPDAAGPCGRCQGIGVRPFKTIGRLSTFESVTRDLVHAIKYGRRWPVANRVAAIMRDQPRIAALLAESDVIVPIPLHWTRRFTRGFNQAHLLAAALAGPARLPVVEALKRIRRTPTQTGLHSRASRAKNVEGAFALRRPAAVRGRRVLLVDDVMTTGATLREAARVLRRGAKPASLSAIVIATASPLKTALTPI